MDQSLFGFLAVVVGFPVAALAGICFAHLADKRDEVARKKLMEAEKKWMEELRHLGNLLPSGAYWAC